MIDCICLLEIIEIIFNTSNYVFNVLYQNEYNCHGWCIAWIFDFVCMMICGCVCSHEPNGHVKV